jgi:hypothetical protein
MPFSKCLSSKHVSTFALQANKRRDLERKCDNKRDGAVRVFEPLPPRPLNEDSMTTDLE